MFFNEYAMIKTNQTMYEVSHQQDALHHALVDLTMPP
jgi:hypothetical protein